MVILCRSKEAKEPLIIGNTGLKIYTVEELCYYIYNNIYLIGNEFIDDALILFLRYGTKEVKLADRIEMLREKKAGLAEIIVTILKSVDYISIEEIEKIRGILNTLSSQNVHERLKARADSYLSNKCFYSAIKCYERIIKDDLDASLPGIFYAQVYHNLGVSYARLFMYKNASHAFENAYKIGQHEESRKMYRAALKLAEGTHMIERDDSTEEEYVLKREIETLMDNARYCDEYRKLDDAEKIKEAGQVTEYYQNIDDILNEWKKDYLRYIS